MTRIIKRSVEINGHPTSVSLEDEFWQDLVEIAKARGVSVNHIATEIDATNPVNLSSAIRVYVLKYHKTA